MKNVRRTVSNIVRIPMEKAIIAGATPNDIFSRNHVRKPESFAVERRTYEIGKGIEFLSH